MNAKIILKVTALVVLSESMYALVVYGMFHPIEICTAISSLFMTNTVHEHVSTYLQQKTDVIK